MEAITGGRVVIVGGGIIGASIAYNLTNRGHRDVVLLERHRFGEGATRHATGGIRQQFSSRVNVELSRRSIPFWENFEDITGSPLDFRRHGYMFLLSDEAEFETFRNSIAMQRELGVTVHELRSDEIADVFPAARVDDLVGGTYTPEDGSASPSDALAGLLRAARAKGLEVCQQTHVYGLLRTSEGSIRAVETSAGPVAAEHVIIAAGPQSRVVGRECGVTIPVFPHSRQAFATAPVHAINSRLPLTVDMATGAYVHPEPAGGTAVIGGNDRDVNSSEIASVDWSRVSDLAQAVMGRFPALADLEITNGWAGLREMTPDDHAIVGPVEEQPGLWVVAGFSGHGFMQSPAVGEAAANWLLDGDPGLDLSALSLSRFTSASTPESETAVF